MPQTQNVTIEITESIGNGTSPSYVKVTVTPDPIQLQQGTHDSIEWTVATSGWSFSQDPSGNYAGVVIKNPGPCFKHDSSAKKKHKWKRVIADNNPYQYTISVTRDSAPNWVVTWDPSIMNN
jgi:hypothetical protein